MILSHTMLTTHKTKDGNKDSIDRPYEYEAIKMPTVKLFLVVFDMFVQLS